MSAVLVAIALLTVSCAAGGQQASAPARSAPPAGAPTVARTTAAALPCAPLQPPATRAVIELEKGGAIVLQLRPEQAPCTVGNFARNAREGRYNGLTFHRVEPGFVIQGGDPDGTGRGGGQQATEPSDVPFTKGAAGIARGGDVRISNLMQFYVCTGACRHLDRQYTNFAQVIAGQEVADAVRVGDRIRTIRIE